MNLRNGIRRLGERESSDGVDSAEFRRPGHTEGDELVMDRDEDVSNLLLSKRQRPVICPELGKSAYSFAVIIR